MKKKLMVLGLVVFAPVFAFAACNATTGLAGTVCKIGDILNTLIPIMITLAIIYFIWGVIKYVISGDEEEKGKARSMIIYGIIGVAVIVGVWGLANLLLTTVGVSTSGTTIVLPTVPTQ